MSSTPNRFRSKPTLQYFDPVLFLGKGDKTPIEDTHTNRFMYNDGGRTVHLAESKGTRIELTPEAPEARLGGMYPIVRKWTQTIESSWGNYDVTMLDFGADAVVYEPMWATRETAQAFGMTLLGDGQSIEFVYDDLVSCQYIYSRYTAYQSPYIGDSRGRELLLVNATDLEHHLFPHVFCSQDDIPLVISVGRYREREATMSLADLWIRPGDCLYLPPKPFSTEYVDLHGDRNSAHACSGVDGKITLVTETTLGNNAVFSADATKPRYFAEKSATVHTFPDGFPS
jgi:hypothetical protein